MDEIVDELARDLRVAKAYDLWYEMREEVLRTYKNDLPERLPLSRQKEFKRIKNMVIQEAIRLGRTAASVPSGGSGRGHTTRTERSRRPPAEARVRLG